MIYIVGIGSAGLESLTSATLKIIEGAGLLVGSKRHLDIFPSFKGQRLPVAPMKMMIEKVKRANAGAGTKGVRVVVLATGDPGLFGIGSLITRECGKGHVRIIPNLSIVQEAFARIKESANGVNIISVHGESTLDDRSIAGAVREIMRSQKCAVYTDAKAGPEILAQELIKKGAKGYRAVVFEALGTGDEKITRGSLPLIAKKSFNPLNLIVLFAPAGLEEQREGAPRFGLNIGEYRHTNGLITKAEVRAVTLSKLSLIDAVGLVMWDIGSGSGSVAIEAAGLLPSGTVYAVEERAVRAKNIEANRARFKRANLEIITARAPSCLKKLPDPERVFVGGGGRGITDILKVVASMLNPRGIVVVNAVTIETLTSATSFFKDKEWPFEVVQINVARSRPVGGSMIMEAENPVSVITAKRP